MPRITQSAGEPPYRVHSRTQSTGYFQGDIAEIILYDRLLPDGERQQVEEYLCEKYGCGVAVAVGDGAGLPRSYLLSSVYPNPFTPQATFQLEVAQAQQVRVSVHDLLGREVVVLHNGVLAPSEHTFMILSAGLGSGVYFVRVVGEQFTAVRRAVLLK